MDGLWDGLKVSTTAGWGYGTPVLRRAIWGMEVSDAMEWALRPLVRRRNKRRIKYGMEALEGHQLALADFDAEKNQGEDQVENGNLDPYGLGFGATVTETDQLADAHLSAWEWGEDKMELKISKEAVHALTELTSSSTIPSSASATEDTSPSTDDSLAVQNDDGPSCNDAPSSSASNNTNSADEWLCDFTNCSKSFTHCHELKYVHNVPSTPRPPANMTKSPQEVSHQALSMS